MKLTTGPGGVLAVCGCQLVDPESMDLAGHTEQRDGKDVLITNTQVLCPAHGWQGVKWAEGGTSNT